MSDIITIKSVCEGWHAPGYRDPQLHLKTSDGDVHIRLTPQAFVELHDALCAQQACIDSNGHAALDTDVYPHQTAHVSKPRTNQQQDHEQNNSVIL